MTDASRTCVENAERQVRRFSQRIQWTPLLLVVSMFAQCGPRLRWKNLHVESHAQLSYCWIHIISYYNVWKPIQQFQLRDQCRSHWQHRNLIDLKGL